MHSTLTFFSQQWFPMISRYSKIFPWRKSWKLLRIRRVCWWCRIGHCRLHPTESTLEIDLQIVACFTHLIPHLFVNNIPYTIHGIFTYYIWFIFMEHLGKYTRHGSVMGTNSTTSSFSRVILESVYQPPKHQILVLTKLAAFDVE